MSYIQKSILVEITNRTKTTITPVAQSEIAHLMNLHQRISCIEDELKKQGVLAIDRIKKLNLAKQDIKKVRAKLKQILMPTQKISA